MFLQQKVGEIPVGQSIQREWCSDKQVNLTESWLSLRL